MLLKELHKMYTKITVKCLKASYFYQTQIIIIWSYEKVAVSNTHVQNFGGVEKTPQHPAAAPKHKTGG